MFLYTKVDLWYLLVLYGASWYKKISQSRLGIDVCILIINMKIPEWLVEELSSECCHLRL